MSITRVERNGKACAVVKDEGIVISDAQSALELVMNAHYGCDADCIAVYKEDITESFFILSSGLAGEILQKFVNYRVKIAIIGDFSGYTSKPLRDFMYESNKGNSVFFVPTEEEAIRVLSR